MLLVIAFGLSACAGPAATVQTAADDRTKTLEELFWARQEAARSRYTQADVDFMTGMISHHAQALVMSALALTNGASPAVQTLCARIINAQNDEIATMQRWLKDRNQAVPTVEIDGLSLTVHGVGMHHTHMPGMLSQEQIAELATAQGPDFDRLFLTYMIQHHKGAITMVEELFSNDGAGQDEASFRLATDINVDQITEIARMQLMLDSMDDPQGDS